MSADREQIRERPAAVSAGRVFGVLASVVRFVCGVFAIVLVMRVLFEVGQANPGNWLTVLIRDWSDGLTLGLVGLFQTENPDVRTIADFGIPAIIWLIVGVIISKIFRRLGRVG